MQAHARCSHEGSEAHNQAHTGANAPELEAATPGPSHSQGVLQCSTASKPLMWHTPRGGTVQREASQSVLQPSTIAQRHSTRAEFSSHAEQTVAASQLHSLQLRDHERSSTAPLPVHGGAAASTRQAQGPFESVQIAGGSRLARKLRGEQSSDQFAQTQRDRGARTPLTHGRRTRDSDKLSAFDLHR